MSTDDSLGVALYGDFRKIAEPGAVHSQLASLFVVIAGYCEELLATNLLASSQNPRFA
jgi:hypothetical protein